MRFVHSKQPAGRSATQSLSRAWNASLAGAFQSARPGASHACTTTGRARSRELFRGAREMHFMSRYSDAVAY